MVNQSVTQGKQGFSDSIGCMTDDVFFAGKVTGDAADAQCLDTFHVGDDRRCPLGPVTGKCFRRKRPSIYQSTIENRRPSVIVDPLNML